MLLEQQVLKGGMTLFVGCICFPVTKLCQDCLGPLDCNMPGSLSFTIWSLLTLMFIESVMLSDHFLLCRPLLLPSIIPSIRVSYGLVDSV